MFMDEKEAGWWKRHLEFDQIMKKYSVKDKTQ